MKIWQGIEKWQISLIAWIILAKKLHNQDQEIWHTKLYKILLLIEKIAPSLSKITKYKIKNALFLEKFPPSAKVWSQRFHLWVNYLSKVIEYYCPKLTSHTNELPFISWVLLIDFPTQWFTLIAEKYIMTTMTFPTICEEGVDA